MVRKICQPLGIAFLQKMGLPSGTAAATADSFVWMAEQDELAAERVLMLIRLLGGGGRPARAVGGAVRELQRYVGCDEPVLETKGSISGPQLPVKSTLLFFCQLRHIGGQNHQN